MKDDATSSIEHPSSPRVDCPRCGYDIGAQAELARAAGTSTGNCSECGLSLEFATLGEAVRGPSWFVESRLGRARLARRAFRRAERGPRTMAAAWLGIVAMARRDFPPGGTRPCCVPVR